MGLFNMAMKAYANVIMEEAARYQEAKSKGIASSAAALSPDLVSAVMGLGFAREDSDGPLGTGVHTVEDDASLCEEVSDCSQDSDDSQKKKQTKKNKSPATKKNGVKAAARRSSGEAGSRRSRAAGQQGSSPRTGRRVSESATAARSSLGKHPRSATAALPSGAGAGSTVSKGVPAVKHNSGGLKKSPTGRKTNGKRLSGEARASRL